MSPKKKTQRRPLTNTTLSRRRFLGYTGATGALALGGLTFAADPALGAAPGDPTLSFATVLRRREDQLRLQIEFWNLRINQAGGGWLDKADRAKPAYLVYDFGPQHLAEEAFFKPSEQSKLGDGDAQDWPLPAPHPTSGGSESPKKAGQVQAVLAESSRLAFEVPDAVLPLAYTTARLLDWLPLQPRVVEGALARDRKPAGTKPAPRAPRPTETAIEYPWHLILSPHERAAWSHDDEAVDQGTGRYELWHTRLAVRGQDTNGAPTVDEDDEDGRTVRAVWGTDKFFGVQVDSVSPNSSKEYEPFRMALTPRDRLDIVRLSSDWRLWNDTGAADKRFTQPGKPFVPEVVDVDRLALSSLGAWLDSSFVNELQNQPGNNYNTSLLQWQNIGAMGRDGYTRVVRKGWLFPFGFKAALITVTERRFDHEANNPAKPKGAYLRQRVFIVVLKADRNYGADGRGGLMRYEGRGLPFPRVSCITRITPDLDKPTAHVPPFADKSVFMPRVDNTPLRFRMRGTDWAGRSHSFDAPLVFVDDEYAYETEDVEKYLGAYDETIALHGARVALAEEDQPGDTTFPVTHFRVAAEAPALDLTSIPPKYYPNEFARQAKPAFFPAMTEAKIAFSDASAVAGRELGSATVEYWFEQTGVSYLTHGFGSSTGASNKGDVFLVTTDIVRPTAGVSTRNAGGMAAPALPVYSVSRLLGPTGRASVAGPSAGPGGVSNGVFDPAEVLDESVKILGGIALVEVLQSVGDFVTNREKALKIVSRRAENPNRVITEVDWHPDLKAAPQLGPNLALFAPGNDARCDIHAEIVADLDDADASSFRIEGRMEDFVVNLFGGQTNGAPADGYTFVRVPFRRLSFRAGSLVQETFEPELGTVTFHGPLAFLEKLAEFMALVPGAGGDAVAADALASAGAGQTANGPYTDVTATGIEVGVGFAVPEIGVGILTLSNLALGSALRIPFDGSAVTLRVAFSSREDPFSLSVWGIGGGGFAGVSLSISGVELLEFALEFGASIGFSVGGIASGKVEIKAGIYFKVETVIDDATGAEVQQCTLEAYIRLHGELDILGIISLSITFYLGLSYNFSNGSLTGEATVTVEIEVAMFSDTVTMTVRKKIAGGGGSSAASARGADADGPLELEPPHITWADLLTQTDWEQYCNSFATIPA